MGGDVVGVLELFGRYSGSCLGFKEIRKLVFKNLCIEMMFFMCYVLHTSLGLLREA